MSSRKPKVVKCSEQGCIRQVTLKKSERFKRCEECRILAARLDAIHNPSPQYETVEERESAKYEEAIRVRVSRRV